MTDTTGRMALPLIAPGQAQKEMTHNEALTLLDIAVQPSVVAAGLNAPPPEPLAGQCWIVGAAPTGDWAGHPHALAGWTAGGWRFLAAHEGTTAWVAAAGAVARHVGGAWRIGAPAIAAPVGGTVVDQPARDAIMAIVAAMDRHGLVVTD